MNADLLDRLANTIGDVQMTPGDEDTPAGVDPLRLRNLLSTDEMRAAAQAVLEHLATEGLL